MARRYWTCPRCSFRNERTWVKCRGSLVTLTGRSRVPLYEPCTGRRPKAHVPKHAIVMRDNGYQHFRDVNEQIHGAGDNCGVCLAVPKDSRNMQREHDHTTGLARGLACWRCNRLMPKQFDLEHARLIVAYLERVELYYQENPVA